MAFIYCVNLDEESHEIHPMCEETPAIVIHPCKDESDSPVVKPKIIQTRRPLNYQEDNMSVSVSH